MNSTCEHPESVTNESPFREGIIDVVGLSSEEKVIWSYAWREVAFMKNAHPLWHRSKVQYPACNMRSDGFSRMTLGVHLPVTECVASRNPDPTAGSYSNLIPEPCYEGGRQSLRGKELYSIVRPVDEFGHLNRLTLRAVTGRAGAPFNYAIVPLPKQVHLH
jgi:hypothetical protein